MTIPLDNLYDYIFSLTGHNNKNLAMYRFSPYGSKSLHNLILHNNLEKINLCVGSEKNQKISWHYKLLFCYDQEPLDYDLYNHSNKSRETIYKKITKGNNEFDNPIRKKIITKKNIAGHPIVNSTIYDKKLLLHSERNSKDLKKYENNGFIGIYYWSHAFIALDWYRFARHDNRLTGLFEKKFNKDFNVYCRAWAGSREYRLKFLSLLNSFSVDNYANIFFNEYDNNFHYSSHIFQRERWQLNSNEIQYIKNIKYITNNNSCSSLSATYSTEDYENSAIDVVLETVFDKDKIQLTEKILRPIACGKPFILASEKDSLKYLKSYGFKTFEPLIDETYDNVDDPNERLKSIVKTMQKISNTDQKEKHELFLEMHKIAAENKKWFFSNEFFSMINSELKNNLSFALNLLDQPEYQTAAELKKTYRACRLYKNAISEKINHDNKLYIDNFHERLKKSMKNIKK